MKIRKVSLIVFIIFISVFIASAVLVKYTKINVSKISDDSFLFTYLGIFLGFALTIFTFIVSMVDKIKASIEKDDKKTVDEKKETQNKIISFYSELKDDIYFIFYSFLIVIVISLFENVINIPNFILSKDQILIAIKLEIFLLSIYAIYDLCSSAFKISESTGVFRNSKNAS